MGLPLTSCKIYELQFAHDNIIWVLGVDHFDLKGHKGVRSATRVVHIMTGYHLVFDTEMVQSQYVIRGFTFKCI
jgi:hypothetical protein